MPLISAATLISAQAHLPILCAGERLQSLGEVIHMLMAIAGLNQISTMQQICVGKWLVGHKGVRIVCKPADIPEEAGGPEGPHLLEVLWIWRIGPAGADGIVWDGAYHLAELDGLVRHVEQRVSALPWLDGPHSREVEILSHLALSPPGRRRRPAVSCTLLCLA